MASVEVGADEGVVCCRWSRPNGSFEGEGIESEKFEPVWHQINKSSSEDPSSNADDDQFLVDFENVLVGFREKKKC